MDKNIIEQGVKLILKGLGEDSDREGLKDTHIRIANMYEELLCNVNKDEKELNNELTFFNQKSENSIKIENIRVTSFCEHHLVPFFGIVNIKYLPKDDKVLGLSKFSRIVNFFAKKPQLQERLTTQIGKFIIKNCHANYVEVKIKCAHLCMSMRGVLQPNTVTETTYSE